MVMGLCLEYRVMHHGHPRSQRVAHPPGALLDDVRQLVAEQLLALGRLGVVLARREVEVGAVSEGQCADDDAS